MLGISTWMVSVLPLRLRRGLRLLGLIPCEDSVICRRRECELFCFLNARTGEIFTGEKKDSVPRFRGAGAGGSAAGGLDRGWSINGERLNNALIFGGLSGGVAGDRMSTGYPFASGRGGLWRKKSVRYPMDGSALGSDMLRPCMVGRPSIGPRSVSVSRGFSST